MYVKKKLSFVPWLVPSWGRSTWIDAATDKAGLQLTPVLNDSEQVLHRMTNPLFHFHKTGFIIAAYQTPTTGTSRAR